MPHHIVWGGLEDLIETWGDDSSASSSSTSRGSRLVRVEASERLRVGKEPCEQKWKDDAVILKALNMDPGEVTFLPFSDSSGGTSGSMSGIGGADLSERDLVQIAAIQAASKLQVREDDDDMVSQEGVSPNGTYLTHRVPESPKARALSLDTAEDAWHTLQTLKAQGRATTAAYNNAIKASIAKKDFAGGKLLFEEILNFGKENEETLDLMLTMRGMASQQSPSMVASSATASSAQLWSIHAPPQPVSLSGSRIVSPSSLEPSSSQTVEHVLDSMLKDVLEGCSDSEDEATEHERQLQLMAQQQHANSCVGLDDGELLQRVPFDANGVRTSVGSANHHSGECVPCVFVNSKKGCLNGVSCIFCHFRHAKKTRKRNKQRPCKGKRERFRKLVNRLTHQILCDPYSFDPASLNFPPSIEIDEIVKNKLVAKLLLFQEHVRAQRDACSPEALTRSSLVVL